MSNLASLSFKLGANISDFQTGMRKASKIAEQTASKLKSVGATMSMAITAPVLAAGGAAIKMASDFSESQNKTRVAFGESSKSVEQFATTTLKSFGIAEGSALEMASLFGDMATGMGMNQVAAADMSTALVGLAGDLSSFKNMNIKEVTTALNGVFTGETESLKRLGIVMTQANLEAFALSQGITKGTKAMTQAEKVQLRYAYVMEMSANALGDFGRTGGGAANQARILQEGTKQLAQTFGQYLLPAFTEALKKLNSVVEWFTKLEPNIKKNILMAAGFAAAIGPVSYAVGLLITSVTGLGAAFAFLTSPIGLVVVSLAAVGAAAVYIADNWQAIKERVSDINWWRNALIDMVKFFIKINPISAFIDAYNSLITYLGGKAIPNPFENITAYLDSLKGETKEYENQFGSFGDAVKNAAKGALSVLGLMNTQTEEITSNTAAATNQMRTLGGVSREVTAAIGSMTMIGSGGMQVQGGEGEGKMEKSGGGLPLFDEMIDQGAKLRETFGAVAMLVGDTMSNAFYQALDSGEDFLKTLGKMLIDVVKKLAAAAASAIALSLAMSLITGGASNAGLLFGMKGVGGLGDLFSGLFGKMSGIPGMASGGIVPAGFPNDTYPAFLSSGETVIPSPQPLAYGNQPAVVGKSVVSGKDLLIVFDRAQKDRNIRRGY